MIPFADLKIDALLVTGLPNVRYLSGFTGSNALMLISPDSQTLFTDSRYTIQAAQECACKIHIPSRGPLELAILPTIRRRRLKRIGFESARLNYDSYRLLKEHLPLGASLKPVGPIIDKLRMVKSAEEIARIRRSVLTNSEAFEKTVQAIRPGVPENAIAAELEFQMRRLGAEKPAFDTIVASGPRSALPHAKPSHEPAGVNELLLIDMGALQDGYCSDMTRMLFLGRPNRRVRAMYKAVLTAQLAAVDGVRAGATARQVDRKARQVMEREGFGKEFLHSTGHGLGLEIHEAPRVAKRDKTVLEADMVITIEPGAYIEGFGGVRIEDTVLVTKTGCEVLTPTPKELLLL